MSDAGRIDPFDGLRAIAFLLVFAFHTLFVPLGFLGVDMFFALSGYLITRNLLALRREETAGRAMAVFYFRRLIRIVPAYFLALAVMLALGQLPGSASPWYFGFASNVHDAFLDRVNGAPLPMWSIAVEEQFYLVWPFVVLFAPRRRLIEVLVAAVAVAAVARWAFAGNHDAVYRLMPCRMDTLALGAILAAIEDRDPDRPPRPGAAALVTVVALGASIVWRFAIGRALHRPQDLPVDYEVVGYGLTAVGFAALLAYVRELDRGRIHAILTAPVLRYLGKISYTAYLMHFVAYELVRDRIASRPVVAAIALAATIGWASLTWYALERPMLGLRHLVRPQRGRVRGIRT
jgi:peptidoglycan/LPS O-acetylase OafA/YrhL